MMTARLRHRIQRGFARLSRLHPHPDAAQAKREVRELVAWIRPRRDQRVLDAGCGPGTLARAMAPLASEVHGLDLCQDMIQVGRGLQPSPAPPLNLSVGDVESLPYRSRSFQLLTCSYSFANFPDPLGVLREFVRVTRRGGQIAIIDVIAPEDPARCAYLNRLESLRSHFYTRILKHSKFLALFRRARLGLISSRVQRRRRAFRDWLRFSPAAANPQRARLLRRILLNSIEGDKAGLRPRRSGNDIFFYPTTAWFMLRRQ